MKEFKLELEKRTREVEEIVYRYLPQDIKKPFFRP